MNRVALLIGGNQGDRKALIVAATRMLTERVGILVAASAIHETEPWGDFGDERPQAFLNQALLIETSLRATEVLRRTMQIEADLGRQRHEEPQPGQRRTYASRPIDIDIIFFNDEVIDLPQLQVPHPRMHLRSFVLAPLAEIMPHYVHPLLQRSVEQMLADIERGNATATVLLSE